MDKNEYEKGQKTTYDEDKTHNGREIETCYNYEERLTDDIE